MPNITLPNGRARYVNPFSMLCDRCERRVNCDWVDERCRYECESCQRDWESEHAEEIQQAEAAEVGTMTALKSSQVNSRNRLIEHWLREARRHEAAILECAQRDDMDEERMLHIEIARVLNNCAKELIIEITP